MLEGFIIGLAVFLVLCLLILPFIILIIFSKKNYGKKADVDYIFNLKDFPDLDYVRADFKNNLNLTIRAYKFFKKGVTDYKAVILLVPGFKNNHNKYLPEIEYFTKRNYCVFSFDPCGTGKSQGDNLVGLYQIPYDALYAKKAIQADKSLNTKPLLLWGYSNGAYAVLSLIDQEVKAVAALSAFDNVNQMTVDYGVMAFGKKAKVIYPYSVVYNKCKFGKAPFGSSVKSLKNSKIPVFLAHSIDDEVVPYRNFEKLKQYNTHPLSINLSLEGRNHWIRYDNRIQRLRDKLELRLEKVKDNERKKIINCYAAVSKKIDYSLLSQVADFYDRVLERI